MSRGFNDLPPVVKNLIVVNVVMLIAYYVIGWLSNIDLNSLLGLYYPKSDLFKPVQIVTHMFMHGGFLHLLFNMWALYMFGQVLESVWGPKRFLTFYFVCGLGAALTHEVVQGIEYTKLMAQISPEGLQQVLDMGRNAIVNHQNFVDPSMAKLNNILNVPTVGASGAIFGLLLAFGMLFPNTEMFIIPFPMPIKAKYLVMGYGALELFLAVTQPGSNIAHVAHLGGMIFGYILIKFWRKTTKTLY
jgi:membrane associated rhomboid family serine protease